MSDLTYDSLKARHRCERDNQPETTSLRIHRALSWLKCAEQCEDADGKFIFLWIAFNAAYAESLGAQTPSQKRMFRQFIDRLIACDRDRRLADAVWNEFSNSIRVLLRNHYVYEPFWTQQNNPSGEHWRKSFDRENRAANAILAHSDTAAFLDIVFTRLYTLRNQLMHGGATWQSQLNRDQVRDCANIMQKLTPLIIQLMMDNPDAEWGAPAYPVV